MITIITPVVMITSAFITTGSGALPVTAIAALATISTCATVTNARVVLLSNLDYYCAVVHDHDWYSMCCSDHARYELMTPQVPKEAEPVTQTPGGSWSEGSGAKAQSSGSGEVWYTSMTSGLA